METIKKKLGTPNIKAQNQRLVLEMEELMKQPDYEGKSIEMAALTNQMTHIALFQRMEELDKVSDYEGKSIEMAALDNEMAALDNEWEKIERLGVLRIAKD